MLVVEFGGSCAGLAQTTGDAQTIWQRQTLTGDWGGLRTSLENAGVTFALQQQSELWANAVGGLSRGGAADGLATASAAVDLDKAVGWRGGNLFASGFEVEGVGPTPLRVGALQLVSGIEATASAKLYDLWFEQQLFGGKFALRFGQEGASDELMLSQHAALYLNSSFGYPPVMALDLPSGGPNYPLATPFVRARYQPNGEITLLGAVYNSDPAPPGAGDPQLRDRHGTAFRLADHTLSFAELWYAPSVMAELGIPATYKLGAWVATGPFADPLQATQGLSLANPASSGPTLQHSTDHAIYAVVDQTLWKTPKTDAQEVGFFVQAMLAPADRNLSDLFVDGGVNWKGPIVARADDVAGLAVTFAGIGANAQHFSEDVVFHSRAGVPYDRGETVLEATYRAALAPWLQLQPDIQYVLDPGAAIPTRQSAQPLKNDLIFGVRVGVTF
ncbi:MAG: carbohydrate porin [Stellaceae bacterium]